MKAVSAILIAMFLVACSSVPITSIPKLRKIDLETTEIETMRVALKYPNTLSYKHKPVNVFLEGQIDGKEIKMRFALEIGARDATDRSLVNQLSEAGYEVDILVVPQSKIQPLTQIREEILAARAAGKETRGSFGFSYTEACLIEKTSEPLIANLYAKTSETGEYVHALRNIDLRAEAQKEGIDIRVCD